MSEELKNCPICNCAGSVLETEADYYEADDAIRCCNACDFYCSEKHWNQLPRLDEKRKAEIVAQMWGEYFCENGSVTPQEPTAKFLHWIEQKAKGER